MESVPSLVQQLFSFSTRQYIFGVIIPGPKVSSRFIATNDKQAVISSSFKSNTKLCACLPNYLSKVSSSR